MSYLIGQVKAHDASVHVIVNLAGYESRDCLAPKMLPV